MTPVYFLMTQGPCLHGNIMMSLKPKKHHIGRANIAIGSIPYTCV